LREIYKKDEQALTEDYAQMMSLARLKPDRIRTDLSAYSESTGFERETLLTELVMRMALTDNKGAWRLLIRRHP
jgi:hypothetical protein